MALNVQDKFNSDFSVATSGYSGPLGGTKKNPVGTVFIAIATETKVISSKFYFSGSRQGIVNQATDEGLRMLIEKIKKEE